MYLDVVSVVSVVSFLQIECPRPVENMSHTHQIRPAWLKKPSVLGENLRCKRNLLSDTNIGRTVMFFNETLGKPSWSSPMFFPLVVHMSTVSPQECVMTPGDTLHVLWPHFHPEKIFGPTLMSYSQAHTKCLAFLGFRLKTKGYFGISRGKRDPNLFRSPIKKKTGNLRLGINLSMSIRDRV